MVGIKPMTITKNIFKNFSLQIFPPKMLKKHMWLLSGAQATKRYHLITICPGEIPRPSSSRNQASVSSVKAPDLCDVYKMVNGSFKDGIEQFSSESQTR